MNMPSFPEYPQFKSFDSVGQADYNAAVADYPAYSDISYETLQIWWNIDKKLGMSALHGNVVMDYHLAVDEANSGIGLIGESRMDESIDAIFASQSKNNEAERLVHVPEFAVAKIAEPDKYSVTEETDFNEYILDAKALTTLEGSSFSRIRRKVARFHREVAESVLETKAIDLSSPVSRDELLVAITAWDNANKATNDPGGTEWVGLGRSLDLAANNKLENMCCFIDGQLAGVVLYHQALDDKSFIIHHLKVDYQYPFIFDYMTQQIAAKATEQDVPYLNMEMDLGIENLRRHKMGLRPVGFVRKFTITPRALDSPES